MKEEGREWGSWEREEGQERGEGGNGEGEEREAHINRAYQVAGHRREEGGGGI